MGVPVSRIVRPSLPWLTASTASSIVLNSPSFSDFHSDCSKASKIGQFLGGCPAKSIAWDRRGVRKDGGSDRWGFAHLSSDPWVVLLLLFFILVELILLF